jgi:hypothetical protein
MNEENNFCLKRNKNNINASLKIRSHTQLVFQKEKDKKKCKRNQHKFSNSLLNTWKQNKKKTAIKLINGYQIQPSTISQITNISRINTYPYKINIKKGTKSAQHFLTKNQPMINTC